MFSYQIVGEDVRPSHWRSVLFAIPVWFFTMISAIYSPAGSRFPDTSDSGDVLIIALTSLAAFTFPVALFWRHRFPFTLTIGAALLALVLPIGNTLALVALAALIGRRRGPAVWLTTALVTVTSSFVVIADARGQSRDESLAQSVLGPVGADPSQMVPIQSPTIVGIIVAGLVISVGLGLIVRARREAAAATKTVHTERQTSTRLGDEAARRQERERVSREVHDVMGHRLSLLNLHAGALEAHSSDDPRLEQSAKLVQQSARAAMDDLRSLLAVLSEPIAEDGPPLPLTELAQVVSESFGAGQPLSSSIFITDADRAHPTLSRAVYRIVQELMTNTRKHAPGEQVLLMVSGAPADGVTIDVRNRYLGGWGQQPPGSARGLAGITERTELLGGRVTYGLDDNGQTFRVRVELPWREV